MRRAWYALRRTLPPVSWQENLDELVAYCPRYGIDEVIVKVDVSAFSHGVPTLQWLKDYQRILFAIRTELERIDVVYSLNPWQTLGHGYALQEVRASFPQMNIMVAHDGTPCPEHPCPLSRAWREHLIALWRIYAETGPAVLWVEDDIRMFQHGPADYGCFCDEHLKEFGRRVGETVTRGELVKRILQSGKPHLFRKAYLDLLGETIVKVVGELEQAVHAISPETKMGLMSSGPNWHCLEGRRWRELAAALKGSNTLVSRPPLGYYYEEHLRGLCGSASAIKLTRRVLPEGTIEQGEVENWPFNRCNKSIAMTSVQSAICFSHGCDGVTLNLFDHCGAPMEENVAFLEALRDAKARFSAMAARCRPEGKFAGVRILHHDRASYEKQTAPGADPGDICSALRPEDDAWLPQLERLGFATTYDAAAVTALSGQAVRCLERDKILELLSQGVLCDLPAVQTLQDMGYEEYVGVRVKDTFRRPKKPVRAEHLFHPDFGGSENRYIDLIAYWKLALFADLDKRPGAFEISEIVDQEADRVCGGVALFENPLGGRVAAYPFPVAHAGDTPFLSTARQRQVRAVLEWLARGPLPLVVAGVHSTLPFRSDDAHGTIAGAFCLSLDPWPSVEMRLASAGREVRAVEVLHRSDAWESWDDYEQANDDVVIRYPREVSFERPVIFAVFWTRQE